MAKTLDTLDQVQADFLRRFVMTGHADRPVMDGETVPMSGMVSPVALQKARLGWDRERKRVAGQLQALEATMVDAFKDADDATEMARIARKTRGVLQVIDGRLLDALDDAHNAHDVPTRGAHLTKCKGLIDAYMADLDSHPLIQLIEGNPFLRIDVVRGMRSALGRVRAELV